MPMLKIIFVDDESSLLGGLKRMLRKMRNEWDMSFFESPAEALEFMQQTDVDVLVTDLRMPGINGAELLKKVIEMQPETVRIVLSGEVGTSLVYETLGNAHRFLSKPVSAEDLQQAISSSVAMRGYLNDAKLLKIVNGIKELPTIPVIYEDLVEALKSPDTPISHLGEIIKRDPGLTAKLLKVVNSAFFGLKNTITDPVSAVNYLGIDAVKSLALSVKAFDNFGNDDVQGIVSGLWDHSERVANMCRKIAESEGLSDNDVEKCYMTGLLHDIGSLIMADNFSDKFLEFKMGIDGNAECAVDQEEEWFGATHGSIGAYLLGLWNIDHAIIEAVAFHHTPRKSQVKGIGPLTILHIAECFSYGALNAEILQKRIDLQYMKDIDCLQKIPQWKLVCEACATN